MYSYVALKNELFHIRKNNPDGTWAAIAVAFGIDNANKICDLLNKESKDGVQS